MPNKKDDGSKLSPEEQALEQRVRTIMEGAQPGSVQPPDKLPPKQASAALPPLDIFNDPKTAPAVPAKLLKKIGADVPKPAVKTTETTPAEKSVTATTEPDPKTAGEPQSENPQNGQPPEQTGGKQVETPVSPPESADLDNPDTDKAVDDIVVNEGDVVLAAEDAAAKSQASDADKAKGKRHSRSKNFFANKRIWLIIAIVFVLGGAFGYPVTRNKLLGLVLKESVSVTVTDSKTNTPVSNAVVSMDGTAGKTDAGGKATLMLPPGKATLQVTKQYYKKYQSAQTVSLKSGTHLNVQLVATGRQVPITVLNRINGKPIANAEIGILDTTAKTNAQGRATIVLPTTKSVDNATVTLSGYNTAAATILVTSSVVPSNIIALTPAGHIYFLSNLSGTIDVVRANLDGSSRKTVLAGTGHEDPNTTSLLTSRDWHYLVLKAQRSGSGPALYLIDTTNDKVTQFDSGNADFTLIGWYGHYFMYDDVRHTVQAWQSGHEELKSYNADNGQLNLLDQSQAEGTSDDYAYQGFYNFYTLNNLLIYNTQWYTYNASGGGYDLTGKSDTIRGVEPDGQGKKDYQSLTASGLGYVQAALFEPQGIYYAAYNYNANAVTYYKFENLNVSTIGGLTQATFNQSYPTYLVSPTGDQTFWTELRDGQNALFTGDQTGSNKQQVASLSGYNPYGWYTDSYLLVSKNNSELYIMPAGGLKDGQTPLKVTDYYKPTQTYTGYGYGYGGL